MKAKARSEAFSEEKAALLRMLNKAESEISLFKSKRNWKRIKLTILPSSSVDCNKGLGLKTSFFPEKRHKLVKADATEIKAVKKNTLHLPPPSHWPLCLAPEIYCCMHCLANQIHNETSRLNSSEKIKTNFQCKSSLRTRQASFNRSSSHRTKPHASLSSNARSLKALPCPRDRQIMQQHTRRNN